MVDCEGAIEGGVKIVYKAMKDKTKTPVNLRFMCTSDWLREQFLDYMVYYISCKKVKKVSHVNVDIYIETKED